MRLTDIVDEDGDVESLDEICKRLIVGIFVLGKVDGKDLGLNFGI
jgi:hypothetical protein